jgi:putative flippase GtrA
MWDGGKDEAGRLVRFGIVGASNTAISLIVYILLLHFGVPYILSAPIAYAAGIANGYTWNRIWTFQTGDFHLPEFSRFLLVQMVGLGLNMALLAFAVEALGMSHLAGEVASLVPVVAVTYALNRWWAFRDRPVEQPGL